MVRPTRILCMDVRRGYADDAHGMDIDAVGGETHVQLLQTGRICLPAVGGRGGLSMGGAPEWYLGRLVETAAQ